MRTVLLFIVLGTFGGCNYPKSECIGDTILIPKHIYIPIYRDKGEHIIDSIINDTIEESYPFISIYKLERNYAYVSIGIPSLNKMLNKKGWVETKYLGTNLSIYDGVVPIRNLPNEKSEIVFQINNPHWGDLYQIIDAHNKWLKIRNIYNPKETGWVAPEYQCNNPYTSCN